MAKLPEKFMLPEEFFMKTGLSAVKKNFRKKPRFFMDPGIRNWGGCLPFYLHRHSDPVPGKVQNRF